MLALLVLLIKTFGCCFVTLLSEYRKPNGGIVPNLIHQSRRIDSITADKVYDQSHKYKAANDSLKINIQLGAHAVVSATDEAPLRKRNT